MHGLARKDMQIEVTGEGNEATDKEENTFESMLPTSPSRRNGTGKLHQRERLGGESDQEGCVVEGKKLMAGNGDEAKAECVKKNE